MPEVSEEIVVTDDGVTMPVTDVLAGRGFITGKSGSGKSNTASVVAEELLAQSLPILIVDTDGEYYGLKQEFEILHVGGDRECDVRIGVEHADRIAKLALDRQVPIILDVSGFVEEEDARELIDAVITQLFALEKQYRLPFLVLVEEVHEFVPESGGLDDLGKTIIRVAKRGRKRGLGLCGISQRPAAVDKDFITQCDWLVWHRLTWENDTRVVGKILGSDSAETVQELDDGEALLMTDWDDRCRRVTFRRKRTFDAGATPGLDDFERPELRQVQGDLVAELEAVDDGAPIDEADGGSGTPTGEPEVVDGGRDPPDAGGSGRSSGGGESSRSTDDRENGRSADDGEPEQGGLLPVPTEPDGESGTGADSGGAAASDGTTDGGKIAEPYRGHPLWEFGQLVVFLARTTFAYAISGLRRSVRLVQERPSRERGDSDDPLAHENR